MREAAAASRAEGVTQRRNKEMQTAFERGWLWPIGWWRSSPAPADDAAAQRSHQLRAKKLTGGPAEWRSG